MSGRCRIKVKEGIKVESNETFLQIELYGHGYSTEIADEVRIALEDTPNSIVRGRWLSSFAPFLSLEVVLSIAQQISIDLIVVLIIGAIEKSISAASKRINKQKQIHASNKVSLRKVQISMPNYDLIFYCDSWKEIVDHGIIIEKVNSLVEEEEEHGRRVSKVVLPVSHNDDEFQCGRAFNSKNVSLWAVEYEEAAVNDPRVYDAESNCFLEGVIPSIDSHTIA